MLNNCVFCKFIDNPNLVSSQLITSNEKFYVMLAANPQTEGHLLVIPRAHFTRLIDLPKVLQNQLFSEAIKKGEELKRKLGAKAFVIKVNNELYVLESHDSQHVGHIHLHVIPRYKAKESFPNKPKREADKLLRAARDNFLMKGGEKNA